MQPIWPKQHHEPKGKNDATTDYLQPLPFVLLQPSFAHCDDHDREHLKWVKKFNPYDLYSKCPITPDWNKLRPFYADLIEKYVPQKIRF